MIPHTANAPSRDVPASLPELSLRVETTGPVAVLAVTGEIDMITAPKFQEALSDLVEAGHRGLVVDLAQVRFFASAGLSALVAAHEQARGRTARDEALIRVVASEATAQPLRITALDRRMPLHDSAAEALAAFGGAASAAGGPDGGPPRG